MEMSFLSWPIQIFVAVGTHNPELLEISSVPIDPDDERTEHNQGVPKTRVLYT